MVLLCGLFLALLVGEVLDIARLVELPATDESWLRSFLWTMQQTFLIPTFLHKRKNQRPARSDALSVKRQVKLQHQTVLSVKQNRKYP